MKHLNKNNLLSETQFRFWKWYSTEKAVYNLSGHILEKLNNNLNPLGKFCDLSKTLTLSELK